MTDPIAAMLIMIKNAGNAERPLVTVPFSKIKLSILECLAKQGYVGTISKKAKKGMPTLEVAVAYKDNQPRVTQVERVSKPSRRMYVGVSDIRSVKNGHGMLVLSTPKGILTDKEARKEQVGGEALFRIW